MDVTINGLPDLSGNYILDLNGVAAGGGSGASSFGSVQYISGIGFQLNLNLESGKSYRVQRTFSLNPTNWVTLTNFTSTGSNVQYLDNGIGNPQAMYRVISP